MNVDQLIEKLRNCRPKAQVNIVIGDEKKDIIDTPNFEVNNYDIGNYIELYIYKKGENI